MSQVLPAPGTPLDEVQTPSLILDLLVLERNIVIRAVPEMGYDLALKVVATVLSRPVPERAVLDCGHKMLGVGLPGVLSPNGATMERLNSEHGILDLRQDAHALRIGDRVELYPWYYGAVINSNRHFIGVRDGRVECVWEIAAQGAHQ